jgi:hypothetical protein
MDALTRRILDHVRDNPGCVTKDILQAMPPRYVEADVWHRVVHLSMVYEIENRGGAGRHEDVRWHILEWEPTPFYLELAQDLVMKLNDLTPRKKALFLARSIQQFTEDREAESSREKHTL